MTDELLDLARDLIAAYSETLTGAERPEAKLCEGVLDLLGEAAPCGYDLPTTRIDRIREREFPVVVVPDSWSGPADPSDARAMARMLLRAADEAEDRLVDLG